MVTRVASFAHSQALIAQLMVAQQRSQLSQIQSSTGTKSTDYQGYGADAARLIAAKTYLATTQQGIDSATQLKATVDAHQLALDRVRSVVQKLTKAVQDGVAGMSATGLMAGVDAALSGLVGALNTAQNGSYLFGGTRSSVPPVAAAAATSAGLLALASTSAAFDQGGVGLTASIAGGGTVAYGQLARTVGQDTLQVLRNIYQYNAGRFAGAGGPGSALTGTLNQSQITFLSTQLGLLTAADGPLINLSATGGVVQNKVADMISRLTAQKTVASKFVGDIQDIDFAAAASRLNDDRAAVEVATKVLSSVNRSNLLDYL